MHDRMLTIKEAAKIVGVSPQTMLTFAQENTLPFIKLGNSWRISLSNLCESLGLKMPEEEVTINA